MQLCKLQALTATISALTLFGFHVVITPCETAGCCRRGLRLDRRRLALGGHAGQAGRQTPSSLEPGKPRDGTGALWILLLKTMVVPIAVSVHLILRAWDFEAGCQHCRRCGSPKGPAFRGGIPKIAPASCARARTPSRHAYHALHQIIFPAQHRG